MKDLFILFHDSSEPAMDICSYCLSVFRLEKSDLKNLAQYFPSLATRCSTSEMIDCSKAKDVVMEQPIEKRAKLSDSPQAVTPSHCILCLSLSDKTQIEMMVSKILDQLDTEQYQGLSTYVIAVHAPLSLKVRRMGMEHLMRCKNSDTPDSLSEAAISDTNLLSQPNQAASESTHLKSLSDEYYVKVNLRSRITDLIEEKAPHLEYSVDSPFLITVKLDHATSDHDCKPVISLALPKLQCKKPNSKLKTSVSTVIVNDAVSALHAQDYRNNMFFLTPVTEACSYEIEFSHKPMFVGGRYNKFSRTLSQTPWIIDGHRKSESSVEEMICDKMTFLLRADSHKFSSSGREDVDVRMLGNGRPFLVEFLNPRNLSFNSEDLFRVQQEINEATVEVQVRLLKHVSKKATDVLRKGDEDKTKHYSALIWTPKEIAPENIEFLSDLKLVEVAQKTPIRVLHRRTLATRKRTVYRVTADYVDSHHFTLCLSTQAGTYVKEFVHGDFGRTKPNLRLMMKQDVDILCLDVLNVELDWPI